MDRSAIHYNTRIFGSCGAALLGGLVYLNALHNPFVYDDYHTVVENRSIVDLTNVGAIVLGAVTRPIVNFSYAFDRALWGPAPLGFHVTNVVLHMLNVVLLFELVRRLGRATFVAFSAAVLFAVHPMMTEAVGYISGRSEVLCATFFMLALMAGRRWLAAVGRVLSDPATDADPTRRVQKDPPYGVFTVLFWLAALATKESAAMFPFVFLAYDYLGLPAAAADRRRRFMRVHLPLIATAVAAGIVRLIVFARVEYPGQVSVHWSYFLLELDVIRRYVWMLVIPTGQTLFHEVAPVSLFAPRAWLAILAVGGMAAAAIRLRATDWAAGFGVLWFLLVLVPSTVLIVFDQGEPMAEHRIYLASCGLFLTVGCAIGRMGEHVRHAVGRGQFAAASALAAVVLSFGSMTIVRNAVWGDPIRIWAESVDLAPMHYRPRLLLGEALQDAGRRDEALAQYRTAIRLRPTDPAGYVKVGQCLAELERWSEAREHFHQALTLQPANAAALNALIVLDTVENRFGIDNPHR